MARTMAEFKSIWLAMALLKSKWSVGGAVSRGRLLPCLPVYRRGRRSLVRAVENSLSLPKDDEVL